MNGTTTRQGTIRAALGYPAFRALLAGLAVSQIGDWLYNLALVTLIYQRTGSALWAGIATGARVAPLIVLGPAGGVLAGWFDRRRLMLACDLLRLALMVALALVAAFRLPAVLLPALAALTTTAGTPYLACVSATTPRLVPDADLPGANAARSAVTAAGIMAGPALGGVLLLIGPATLAFAVNAATFGVAALCVLAIRDRSVFALPAGRTPASGTSRAVARQSLGSLGREIAEGAAALRSRPAAIRLVGADVAGSFVYGAQTVVFVLVARQAGLGLHGYGYLFAAVGAGALAGTALAGRVLRLPARAGTAIATGLVGLSMIAMPGARIGAVAVVLAGASGLGSILVEVMTETSLQRTLPEEAFGRAYGLAIPAAVAGIAAGSLSASALVSGIGLDGTLIACGGVALACGVLLVGRRPVAGVGHLNGSHISS